MSRSTVYCVTCGERVSGERFVTVDGQDFCVPCWQTANPGQPVPEQPRTQSRTRTGVTDQPLIPSGRRTTTGHRSARARTSARRLDSRVQRSGTAAVVRADRRASVNLFLFAISIGLVIGAAAVFLFRGGGTTHDGDGGDDGRGPSVVDAGSDSTAGPGSDPAGSGSTAPGSGHDDGNDDGNDDLGSGPDIVDDDAWKRAVCEGGPLIGNERSHKLHLHDCRWGSKTSAKNRKDYHDVDVALRLGFEWCGECKTRVEAIQRRHR